MPTRILCVIGELLLWGLVLFAEVVVGMTVIAVLSPYV